MKYCDCFNEIYETGERTSYLKTISMTLEKKKNAKRYADRQIISLIIHWARTLVRILDKRLNARN